MRPALAGMARCQYGILIYPLSSNLFTHFGPRYSEIRSGSAVCIRPFTRWSIPFFAHKWLGCKEVIEYTRQSIIQPSQKGSNMSQVKLKKLACFGCTGNTGTAVLRTILSQQSKSANICLFVRSAKKVRTLFPNIDGYSHMEIVEGKLNDHASMTHCLSGATHIMCTVGSNHNTPGMRMHRDAVDSILAALHELKEGTTGALKRPHTTFLSSESISETFTKQRPPFLHRLLMNALNHIY